MFLMKGQYTYYVNENCLISKTPTPFVHLCPKLFNSLDFGRPISNEPTPPPLPPSPTKYGTVSTPCM